MSETADAVVIGGEIVEISVAFPLLAPERVAAIAGGRSDTFPEAAAFAAGRLLREPEVYRDATWNTTSS